ncbi:hypothetical protein L5515_005201 [Caenorhabditis briggsae]|uniref:Uncharacterized protein n=1 Tax=Caenorhabditis briggsae TaxID=6238 RepID=A0AAE9ER01_CAEBR|nr:hypothetical protein L5515_005201 [Caenorhabditis briggsae]
MEEANPINLTFTYLRIFWSIHIWMAITGIPGVFIAINFIFCWGCVATDREILEYRRGTRRAVRRAFRVALIIIIAVNEFGLLFYKNPKTEHYFSHFAIFYTIFAEGVIRYRLKR